MLSDIFFFKWDFFFSILLMAHFFSFLLFFLFLHSSTLEKTQNVANTNEIDAADDDKLPDVCIELENPRFDEGAILNFYKILIIILTNPI